MFILIKHKPISRKSERLTILQRPLWLLFAGPSVFNLNYFLIKLDEAEVLRHARVDRVVTAYFTKQENNLHQSKCVGLV